MFPGTRQAPRPLSHNVRGLFMFIWVWNILITYHDVRNLHIHERLYKCTYGCMLGCMSTPLYIHVTHTQHIHTLPYTHTHIHTHHTNRNIQITRTNQLLIVKSTILCCFHLFDFVFSLCVCVHVCICVKFCLVWFWFVSGWPRSRTTKSIKGCPLPLHFNLTPLSVGT